jgi:hypothetical protein
MSNENQSGHHPLYERRYRTSKYFLNDQLRYSEAIQDIQSVKTTLCKLPQFSLRQAFHFATETVNINKA